MTERVLRALLDVTVTSSLLIAALILFRRVFMGKISPRLQYAVWALALARLLIPVSLPSPVSVMNALPHPSQAQPMVISPRPAPVQPAPALPDTAGAAALHFPGPAAPAAGGSETGNLPVVSAAPDLAQILLVLWFAGMLAVLAYTAFVNIRFVRRVRWSAVRLPRVRCELPVYVMGALPSPCLVGLARPKIIVIPQALQNPRMLRHVLTHETCHFRQRDNWVALLRTLCCAVYWFNPLVWCAASLSKADCELSCDSRVLERLGENERVGYGETLLALVRRERIPAGILHSSTAMAARKSRMKERIHMITKRPKALKITIFSAAAVLVAVSAVTLTGALKGGDSALAATNSTATAAPIGSVALSANPTASPSAAPSAVPSASAPAQPVSTNGAALPVITIPKQLADPEKTLTDYFKSVGYDAKLKSKDDNVESGGKKGLFLTFDLGGGAGFQATVFKNAKTGLWDVVDSGFISPKGALLASLIEQKLDEMIASRISDDTEWNKKAFEGNTLLEIAGYGQPAYEYMLSQFAGGKGAGARGDLMANACAQILGYRNNVPKGWKSGEEWYAQLKPLELSALPPAAPPTGSDPEALATAAAMAHTRPYDKNGIVLAAPHVYDKLEKNGTLTVWATVYCTEYLLYGNKLVENGASVVPAAIKFRVNADGSYSLSDYIEAQDGSRFTPSIREFCKGRSGLADKMIRGYSDNKDLGAKLRTNLIAYLKANNLTGIYFEDFDGVRSPLT